MKIPLSWVSLFCPVSETLRSYGAKGLAHEYSIRTAEVEGVENFDFDARIVVARVLSVSKHPDSDHLNLVRVSVGNAERGIVCGAANVASAKYVPLATEGAVLPGGFEIKRAKIRGQESEGMICSLDELGLQEERAEGIFPLETAYSESFLESMVGRPFAQLPLEIPGLDGKPYSANLSDTVFEIDNKFITNRPDLFSVQGNAREFGTLFDSDFRAYSPAFPQASGLLAVSVETDRVLAYRLAKIENVAAAKSPFAVETLLRRSGLNPKFDLVDVTNFVMTELGQPMHAFDADKVRGNVRVRLGRDGERMLALDGKEYPVTAEDVVIADETGPIAIAGVIGGAATAVSESTKNVLLESATFDPVSVRMTAARIGCRTDASTRFEKSLDPLLTAVGMERAVELLRFFGKTPSRTAEFSFLDEKRLKSCRLSFPFSFVASKLGVEVPESDALRILSALGFSARIENGVLSCEAPSWRVTKDISIKEDVVEEIGRAYGYSNVPETPFVAPFAIAPENREIDFRNRIASHFVAHGYFEAYAYSFTNEEKDRSVGFPDMSDAVRVVNAVSAEYTHMRRSPAPLLLSAASENAKRADGWFAFFEYGKIHAKNSDGTFVETRSLAGISVGAPTVAVRGHVTSFLRASVPAGKIEILQGADARKFPFLHPNRSGTVRLDGTDVAVFGAVHPKVAASY